MGFNQFWVNMAEKEIKVHRRVIRLIFPMIQRTKNNKSVQRAIPVYNNSQMRAATFDCGTLLRSVRCLFPDSKDWQNPIKMAAALLCQARLIIASKIIPNAAYNVFCLLSVTKPLGLQILSGIFLSWYFLRYLRQHFRMPPSSETYGQSMIALAESAECDYPTGRIRTIGVQSKVSDCPGHGLQASYSVRIKCKYKRCPYPKWRSSQSDVWSPVRLSALSINIYKYFYALHVTRACKSNEQRF